MAPLTVLVQIAIPLVLLPYGAHSLSSADLAAASGASGLSSADWPAPSLKSAELIEILTEEWENDYAVMLMASWCRYCRQFKPIWHEIRKWFNAKKVKNLEVVMFDCETDVESQRLCAALGVRHYPSVLFVGHGSYWASDPFSVGVLGMQKVPERSILYAGDLFFESVRDWCRTMRFLSRVSRWTSTVARTFGFGSSSVGSGVSRLEKLKAENTVLKAAVSANAELDAARVTAAASNEKLALKYGTGLDPFEVLSAVDYGLANSTVVNESDAASLTAIKRCVAEITAQYCEGQMGGEAEVKAAAAAAAVAGVNVSNRQTPVEPYCERVVGCWRDGFKSKVCRPTTCPLHEAGCAFTSICLNSDVLDQFMVKTSGTSRSEAGAAAQSASATGEDVANGGQESPTLGDDVAVDDVDPGAAAAAAAASAAATGIGGARSRSTSRRSGPRRRSLWDQNPPPSEDSGSPGLSTGGSSPQETSIGA